MKMWDLMQNKATQTFPIARIVKTWTIDACHLQRDITFCDRTVRKSLSLLPLLATVATATLVATAARHLLHSTLHSLKSKGFIQHRLTTA